MPTSCCTYGGGERCAGCEIVEVVNWIELFGNITGNTVVEQQQK